MKFINSKSFAKDLDRKDSLKKFRKEFHFPKIAGKDVIYLCGNSLGLQPKSTKKFILEELRDWSKLGVEGHFHGKRPWLHYHKFGKKALARLLGAKPDEVVAMNQLTVNLHLMLTSFYKPTGKRFKILTEGGAFSSDQYAIESQIRLRGLEPDKIWIELSPRPGEYDIRTEDILKTIDENRESLSLVFLGGVQYYSGQLFDIGKITAAAHQAGALAGFDLAHAMGNVPMNLHNDQVDFAVWCGYKYLNSGPGSVAGAFVHNHFELASPLPRLSGWWGHQERDRFQMKKGFLPMPGVDGWQISNFPVLSGAAHLASLEIFEQAGIQSLRKKSILLTGYLEFLLQQIDPVQKHFIIITPSSVEARGAQLSILMKKNGRRIFQKISSAGIIADWREPDVIRVAPVPLYNTFEEVYRFADIFKKHIGK